MYSSLIVRRSLTPSSCVDFLLTPKAHYQICTDHAVSELSAIDPRYHTQLYARCGRYMMRNLMAPEIVFLTFPPSPGAKGSHTEQVQGLSSLPPQFTAEAFDPQQSIVKTTFRRLLDEAVRVFYGDTSIDEQIEMAEQGIPAMAGDNPVLLESYLVPEQCQRDFEEGRRTFYKDPPYFLPSKPPGQYDIDK